MPTVMLFGNSNYEDGLIATELRDVHGYTPVGSQENPAGVFHEGYRPSRNSLDMVTNAGFPVHFTQADNFESSWVSGSPNPGDIPDYVVIGFGTNHLREWVSGNGNHYYYPEIACAFQGALIRYFRRIWPTAKIVATLYVDGHEDPAIAAWTAYEAAPYNAAVGAGRAYWLARRDEYAKEWEALYVPLADAYYRADLSALGAGRFTDDVHMTALGVTDYAAGLHATIQGIQAQVCRVSGTVLDPEGAVLEGASVRAILNKVFEIGSAQVFPGSKSTTSAANGTWSIDLPRGGVYDFRISHDKDARLEVREFTELTIPDQALCPLTDLTT